MVNLTPACSPEGLKLRKEIMKRHRQKYQYHDADADVNVDVANKATETVVENKATEAVPGPTEAVPGPDPVVENKATEAVPDAKPSENVPVKDAAVTKTVSRINVCFWLILVGTVLIGIFVAFMLRNPTPHDDAGEGDGPSSTAIKLVEWLKLPVQKLVPSVLQQHIPMLSSSVLELPSSSSYEYNDGDVDDKKWLELLGE